jgi:hypothetical protein
MSLLQLLRTGKGPMDGWVARAYDRGVQAAFRDLLPALVDDLFESMKDVHRGLDVGCGPGQFTYPRVFQKALSPAEARQVFLASPFGAPRQERLLLDGVFWVFEVGKLP